MITWSSWVLVLEILAADRSMEKESRDAEAAVDIAILKTYGVEANSAGLEHYFRARSMNPERDRMIRALVKDLGDDRYPVREKATRQLQHIGVVAIPFLEAVQKHPDQEVTRRAVRCLASIRENHPDSVLISALHTAIRQSLPELLPVLVDVLPSCTDRLTRDELYQAIGSLNLADRSQRLDPHALVRDPSPHRQVIGGYLLALSPRDEERRKAIEWVVDQPAEYRFRIAEGLLCAKDPLGIPPLISLLGSESGELHDVCDELLREIASDKAPAFLKENGAAAQKAYQAEWQEWWKANQAQVDLAKHGQARSLKGYTVCIEYNTNTVWECSRDGKIRWSFKANGPMDARVLPGEKILVAEQTGRCITERDKEGHILWQHKVDGEPLIAERLGNGNTFIGTRNHAIIVRRDGVELSRIEVSSQYLHAIRRCRDGTYLGLTNQGQVISMDSTGKVLQSFKLNDAGSWGDVDKLPNGHFLVSNYGSGFVREVDSQGKQIREVKSKDASGVSLVQGGRLLVCGGGHAAEIDWTGKVHWEVKSAGCVRRANRR